MDAVKVGIVVPYSWSFWGAVVEHAELQAEALRRLGCDVRLLMGNDPPGQFTRVLHPRHGRHGDPPPDVIPLGRSVIVPANGSLPNIVLSPRSILRVREALRRARFGVVGADPLRVRLLLRRLRVAEDGIDVLGFLSQERLTEELLRSKALVAPSLGGESFGLVLTRAFACATPVAASDIDGYRDVTTPETSVVFPPGDEAALVEAVCGLLDDEARRRALGAAARELVAGRYSWDAIARRLLEL